MVTLVSHPEKKTKMSKLYEDGTARVNKDYAQFIQMCIDEDEPATEEEIKRYLEVKTALAITTKMFGGVEVEYMNGYINRAAQLLETYR